MTTPTEDLKCLDGPAECRGAVKLRMPLSGSGEPFARCDGHWSKRLDLQDRIRRDYPDSDVAPAWFSEADAGERWNEES